MADHDCRLSRESLIAADKALPPSEAMHGEFFVLLGCPWCSVFWSDLSFACAIGEPEAGIYMCQNWISYRPTYVELHLAATWVQIHAFRDETSRPTFERLLRALLARDAPVL